MKMKLSGLDRLNIPIMLDRASIEGSESEMITLKEVKRDLLNKIQMDDKDLEFYRIQPRPGGGVSWNVAAMSQEKDYDLSNPEITILKQCRETLDNKRLVTEQLLDTCLKIKKMR